MPFSLVSVFVCSVNRPGTHSLPTAWRVCKEYISPTFCNNLWLHSELGTKLCDTLGTGRTNTYGCEILWRDPSKRYYAKHWQSRARRKRPSLLLSAKALERLICKHLLGFCITSISSILTEFLGATTLFWGIRWWPHFRRWKNCISTEKEGLWTLKEGSMRR